MTQHQVNLLLAATTMMSFGMACMSIYYTFKDRRRHRNCNFVLPKKMLLIRHGESQGNISDETYHTTPDPKVALSALGRAQAEAVGHRLKEKIGNAPAWVYCSCYLRARETAQLALRQLDPKQVKHLREDPRLREQEFCGTFQSANLPYAERNKYSKFFYRWETGESAADVYDRVSLFISTMWRDFSSPQFINEAGDEGVVLIFTHGLTSRIFLMNWLHWVFEEFDSSANPGNCDILELTRNDSKHSSSMYRMTEETKHILFGSPIHDPKRASYMSLWMATQNNNKGEDSSSGSITPQPLEGDVVKMQNDQLKKDFEDYIAAAAAEKEEAAVDSNNGLEF